MVSLDDMRQIAFFTGIDEDVLSDIATTAERRACPAGTFLADKDDEAREVFFLLSGSVEFLTRFQGVDYLYLGQQSSTGALLGWSAFRSPYRYSSFVRCTEDSSVVAVPREAFEQLFHDRPAVGYRLLQRAVFAMAHRVQETRGILTDDPEPAAPAV